MIYMFCLYYFTLKCIIKKIIYHRTIHLRPIKETAQMKKKNWLLFTQEKIMNHVVLNIVCQKVGFSLSTPKHWFIFYNSFSLRLTENLHEQKHCLT